MMALKDTDDTTPHTIELFNQILKSLHSITCVILAHISTSPKLPRNLKKYLGIGGGNFGFSPVIGEILVLTSALDHFPFESVCRIGFLLSYNGVEIVFIIE
jgi:hypothetical protein